MGTTKPKRKTIIVRVDPELYLRVKIDVARRGITMQSLVTKLLNAETLVPWHDYENTENLIP